MYCICAVFGSIRIFGQRIHNPSDLRFRGIRLFAHNSILELCRILRGPYSKRIVSFLKVIEYIRLYSTAARSENILEWLYLVCLRRKRFSCSKIILSTFSSCNEALLIETVVFKREKTRSLGALLAGRARYLRASLAMCGRDSS